MQAVFKKEDMTKALGVTLGVVEKKQTIPPLTVLFVPSSFILFSNVLAILKAIFVAREVLPIDGLPAIISKSEGCNPPNFLSKSIKPVDVPDKPPSC